LLEKLELRAHREITTTTSAEPAEIAEKPLVGMSACSASSALTVVDGNSATYS
jgi:hypothetical protein